MHKVDHASARGACLITDVPFAQGDLIATIHDCAVTPFATYQTIQIGRENHLEDLGVIAYLNHSCQPNTIIDTTGLAIYASRDITVGEELSFFYPSTEWEMARPFVCACGAPSCIRLVAGAKYLSVDVLSRYYVNAHIREMVSEALMRQPVVSVQIEPTNYGVLAMPAPHRYHESALLNGL